MTSKCWQIVFAPQSNDNPILEKFLEEYFSVVAQNYLPNGDIEFVGYVSFENFDEENMIKTAMQQGITLPDWKIIELKSENWLKDYVIEFDAFETDDFCIYGTHQKNEPASNKMKLSIYAATAFGSNHPTTLSCIKALSELKHQNFEAKDILDMGCGSGILSLCSAKFWKESKITAADIDEEAIVVTLSNAERNNLKHQINTFCSNGYQNPQIIASSPYDLILSNILANPLKEFAPNLAQTLKKGGFAIISGFVENQFDDVVDTHRSCGLELIKSYSHDNWRAALLQKV